MAAKKEQTVPNGLHVGAELGTDKTLYFRWSWSRAHTDHYEVRWEYTTGNTYGTHTIVDPKTKKKRKVGNAIWFSGSESSVNADGSGISTYNYPDNAKTVRVKVKAVATENSDNKPYWTGSWSAWIEYKVPKVVGTAGTSIKNGVANLNIKPEKNNDSTLHAYWQWTLANTDLFYVRWYYTDNTQITVTETDTKTKKQVKKQKSLWYLGSAEEVEYNSTQKNVVYTSTYSMPASAGRVKARVEPISKIKEETDTVIRYYWNAPNRDAEYTIKSQTEVLSDRPNNTRINIQNGTSNGLVAYWDWNKTNTDHFDYRWEYTTGDKRDGKTVYFASDSGSTTNTYCLYTLPDNAIRARFVVTPICVANASGYVSWRAKNSGYIYSPIVSKLSSKKVKNFVISREIGTESNVFATWDWSESYTDHYEVRWIYTTGNKNKSGNAIWFEGSKTTTTEKQSTYSIPSNAIRVQCKVLPVANASRWTAEEATVAYGITTSLPVVEQKSTTVTSLSIERQSGTARTFVATWDWAAKNETDHYKVEWQYQIKTTTSTGTNNIWIRESERSTTSGDIFYDVYNAPENTDKIQVRVTPIAKTKKVQGIDTAYWTAKVSGLVVYDILLSADPGVDPPVPETPSVLMNGLNLTASVNIYEEGADIIEFDIVKDDSSLFRTTYAKVSFAHAEINVDVAIGGEYKVRARSLRVIKGFDVDSVLANPAVGNSERGDWSEYSSNVGTIPATPEQILSHTVETDTSIYLQWSQVLNSTGYKIEYTTNKDYFDESGDVKSITTGSSPAYHVSGLETGKSYFFRVCATNNNGESGWSPIYSFVLGTRPSPPTTWSDTTKGIIGDDIYLYWTHNSEDSSPQRDVEIEITPGIGAEPIIVKPSYPSDGSIPNFYIFNSTVTVNNNLVDDSAEAILDSDSDNILSTTFTSYPEDTAILWRVRTMGVLDQWSDWSTQRVIMLYSKPTIALYVGTEEDRNERSYEVDHYPLYIYAEAFPKTQHVVGYTVSIIADESYETVDRIGDIVSIRDKQSVFERYYTPTDGNILNISLAANDVNLDNEITYTVIVSAAMDSGLSGMSDWTFTARWNDIDLLPDAEVTVNTKTLCAYIRPYCMTDSGGYTLNVLMSVYRIEYDGRLVLIAENLPNGETTVVDPHPSLNYARYRVVATDGNTGEMGFRDIPNAFVGETAIVIQWDETWRNFNTEDGTLDGEYANSVYFGSMLKLPYNVAISDSNDLDVALNEYIGRSHPVSYYGTQLGVKGNWSAVIPRDDIETLYALRRLAIYRGDVYVREPSGVGYWANISVSFNRSYSEMTIPVTLNVTRVEGGI